MVNDQLFYNVLNNITCIIYSEYVFTYYYPIFTWPCVLSDRPPVLWWLSHGEGRVLKIKAQLSSIWAKGCILMTACVCIIWLDMTTPPWCREKVMVYHNYFGIKLFIVLLFLAVRGSRWITDVGICWLGNSTTASGSSDTFESVGPSYS